MRKNLFFDLDSEDANSLVNLTPLLDVLFVVLILFIFITPFIELDKVNLVGSEIPKEAKKQLGPNSNNAIVITVTRNNQILLNHKITTLNELKFLAPKLHEKHPNESPLLFHDEKAPFGSYQTIKSILESAGFQEMDVVLQTK